MVMYYHSPERNDRASRLSGKSMRSEDEYLPERKFVLEKVEIDPSLILPKKMKKILPKKVLSKRVVYKKG